MGRLDRSRGAFTLLEVLAVLLLTGLVIGVALDFYVDLSRATNRAADHTRGVRRATAILDRLARDLEGAVLVRKPPEADPLSHPWIFLAESRYAADGSDHLKFVKRGQQPWRTDRHESDLAVVSYTVRRDEGDRLELLRWTSSQLPEGLDRDFPPDEEALLVADGLALFALRFLDEQGEWVGEWDSSQLTDSGELPLAVELEVALAPAGDGDLPLSLAELDALPRYSRVVLLPLRPLDLVALLDPEAAAGAGGGEGEGDEEGEGGEEGGGGDGDLVTADGTLNPDAIDPGRTLGECVAQLPQAPDVPFVAPSWEAFLQQNVNRPLRDLASLFRPEHIKPECL